MHHKPLSIAILTALAAGDTFRYEIFRRVQKDGVCDLLSSDREIYREIPRLLHGGLVEADTSKPATYRLTPRGRSALKVEHARATKLGQLLRQRL